MPLSLQSEKETRTIGRVEHDYPETDFFRVSPIDGSVPVPYIAWVIPPAAIGQLTKIGLAEIIARNKKLHKFEAFSGHMEGRIHGIDGLPVTAVMCANRDNPRG